MANTSWESPPTAEEVAILRLHMLGLSDRAIARRLCISLATVRRRATQVRARCGARTRAEAIARLVAAGILTVDDPTE